MLLLCDGILQPLKIIFGAWEDIVSKVLASKQENLNLVPEPMLDKITTRVEGRSGRAGK